VILEDVSALKAESHPRAERRWVRAGMRVRRGPDWAWGDQDGGVEAIGVLVEVVDSEGWARVRWSNGSEQEYRWGAEEKYDLRLVDLELLPRLIPLKRGMHVIRGIDWEAGVPGYANQDGGVGRVGVVLGDAQVGDWVRVRWLDNQYENDYRWGVDDHFDLAIVN